LLHLDFFAVGDFSWPLIFVRGTRRLLRIITILWKKASSGLPWLERGVGGVQHDAAL